MKNKKDLNIEVIELEQFQVMLVRSRPLRLEAKIVFGRDHISQKLIFSLMDMSHKHGLACSAPRFGFPEKEFMTFLIGAVLPTIKSLDKFLRRMYLCLQEIEDFTVGFAEQLDFNRLDMTMFEGLDFNNIYPERFAAIRDQNYNGSWDEYFKDLKEDGDYEEAKVVGKFIEFENINKKDIGLVGHKLDFMLQYFADYEKKEAN